MNRTHTRAFVGAGAFIVAALLAVGVAGASQQRTAEPSCRPGVVAELTNAGGYRVCPGYTLAPDRPAGPTTSPKPTPSPSASIDTPSPTTVAPQPIPTTSAPKPSPSSPQPTTTTPSPTPTVGQGRTMNVYLTGYSYYDNTPPGSSDISHPWAGRDAEHRGKAAGTGTWADPITVAVGHSLIGGKDVLDWPAGTRFYLPSIHRYLIVEDSCGDGSRPQNGPCHTGYPDDAETWLDVWVDGQSAGRDASDDCMSDLTGVVVAIVDPPANLPVTAGPISSAKGCG